jgi:hypothetical protein
MLEAPELKLKIRLINMLPFLFRPHLPAEKQVQTKETTEFNPMGDLAKQV